MFERMFANDKTARELGKSRLVHFVGIGGVGMSGIAEVLLNLGFTISGSDIKENAVIKHLKSLGAIIVIGHKAINVSNADVIVVSSAVSDTNPEVIEAKNNRIPVVPRAAMLAELMRFRYGIAVAGTHGKTTTTSLVASVLGEGGLDPTFVIGGKLNSAGTNARLGESRYLVAEADESDASFLFLQPMISIVTNIDADHMDTYDGDFEKLKQTFVEFLHHLPFYGLAVLCIDDETVNDILPEVSRPFKTYGFSEKADFRVTNVKYNGATCSFSMSSPFKKDWLQVKMNMPGDHNIQNAMAAIVVANQVGVDDQSILDALVSFSGIGRRFQVYGDLKIENKTVLLVDDYGHHPIEVKSMFKTIRDSWPGRRMVVIFQPHRYTRTRDLFEDFANILIEPDVLLLTEVFSAGEEKIPEADGRSLTRAVRIRGKNDPVFVEKIDELPAMLVNMIEDGDILLTLGAGDVGTVPGMLEDLFSPALNIRDQVVS
ncbi:MAG: UDP-N-acetylmuramate--L-alanine ligase [Gammaproteobacteria bacterium]|nr:UDP-N-acetylmuramate--L-alanine ligase [Gammaproteobacteria bacterium]